MSHVTHVFESCHACVWVMWCICMGWLRSVGSLKLYVSLENIGLFCRALLQKRPIILRSLLIVATPYESSQTCEANTTQSKKKNQMSRVTEEWFMSHMWMSHVRHMNESCHTYEWVMSHIWMSHGHSFDASCKAYEWVMSHIWTSHVKHAWHNTCVTQHLHTKKYWQPGRHWYRVVKTYRMP